MSIRIAAETPWYELFSRGARDWLRHNQKVRSAVKESLPELLAGAGDSVKRFIEGGIAELGDKLGQRLGPHRLVGDLRAPVPLVGLPDVLHGERPLGLQGVDDRLDGRLIHGPRRPGGR